MNLTKIKLHGRLGETVGKSEWELYVSSTREALIAINALSGRRLLKSLMESNKKREKYHVLINGRDFASEKEIKGYETREDIENIKNSELCLQSQSLKTIDIIPAIEGAGEGFMSFLAIVVGILLIVLSQGNPALIMAGIGLIAAGITTLMMSPPVFEPIREIEGKSASFLFDGPQQTEREGGPVPIGYGEMMIGSQVIAASYSIEDVSASAGQTTS